MKLPVIERPKGIVVFCPYINGFLNKTVRVYISRYSRKPSSIILSCSQPQEVIADLEGVMKKQGLLFHYNKEIENGFYRVEITCESKRGEEIYPILHDETSLIIGLPYSAYLAININ